MESEWTLPDRGTIGIIFLIITESALFTIFVVAYLVYVGKESDRALSRKMFWTLPVLATICLLSSSATIVLAEHSLRTISLGALRLWWFADDLPGHGVFDFNRAGMAQAHFQRPSDYCDQSCSDTTYYSLVGLHASHVIVA